MSKPNYRFLAIFTAGVTLLIGAVGCQPLTQQFIKPTFEEPGTGVRVTPAYSVLEEKFQTEIVNIGLDRLGYDVQAAKELEYATMHTDLAYGGIDFIAVHWDRLHRNFYNNSGGDKTLEAMGVIVDNVIQGYSIDKATAEKYNINNLKDLQDPKIAQLFDTDGNGKANLTGCNPGWGCELVIEHHLDEYGLRKTVEHDQGQYFALIANTLTRYEENQPVLYYTWTPLWVGSVLITGEDVIWLEVPYTSLPKQQGNISEKVTTFQGKNLGFAVDQIQVLTNQDFVDENPAAAKFLELVQIPREDISVQNRKMRNGEDSPQEIRNHAKTWVNQNQNQFDQWLLQAREAAQQATQNEQQN